ncbi:hypothetical protein Bhyg_03053, partial [Pseudolycoriella hygida]
MVFDAEKLEDILFECVQSRNVHQFQFILDELKVNPNKKLKCFGGLSTFEKVLLMTNMKKFIEICIYNGSDFYKNIQLQDQMAHSTYIVDPNSPLEALPSSRRGLTGGDSLELELPINDALNDRRAMSISTDTTTVKVGPPTSRHQAVYTNSMFSGDEGSQWTLNEVMQPTSTANRHQVDVHVSSATAMSTIKTNTSGITAATSDAPVAVPALTQSQIAARHVVPRKLPLFFGDIEKFPSFLRAYETSTSLCGFSNGENLTRLNESLKGSAYEFVEQQLLYPDDVPQVIETLKVIFGRPEYVIDKLLEKISKQPPPQAEDLSSLVKYSMNVQNICGTIKAANATEHLNNPSLMKALVDKLPPSIQLNWACHKQNVPDVNLYTLGMWLRELAKLACSVSGPPKIKNQKKFEK